MKASFYTVKYFFKLMRSKHIRIRHAIFIGLISSLIGLILPWFSKVFIDEILINQNSEYVFPLLFSWLFFETINFLGSEFRKVYTHNASEGLVVDAGVFILEKIHNCSKLIFNKYSPGSFITNIHDITINGYIFVDIINELTEIIVYLIALPFAFLIIDPFLSLIVGSTVVLCVLSSLLLSRVIDKLHNKKRKEEASYLEKILNAIEGTFYLKSYKLKRVVFDEILTQNHKIRNFSLNKTVAAKISRFANSFFLP